jgi:hypothetical protein|tara:strand:+ start:428 stop:1363 length:936 start_codon:yes stop_codon:yes gene_type:complete
MASNIRDKRKARKSSGTIKTNDELYNSLGDEAFITLDEEELKATAIEYVTRKRLRPLLDTDYNYKELARKYSKKNTPQQLGNYRQAMEFLAHITLSKNEDNDKIVGKLKDMIYSYPNVDISSFVNKHHAILYSWITENLSRVYGQKYLGTVYILGGGIGILGAMMLDTTLRYENIRNLDINGACKFLADELMKEEVLDDWRFKSSTQDVFDVDYIRNTFATMLPDGSISKEFSEEPGLIINTNISHIKDSENWFRMIPDTRKLVIVGETGDVPRPYASSKQFNDSFQMAFTQYTGVVTVDDKQYFMKIGLK